MTTSEENKVRQLFGVRLYFKPTTIFAQQKLRHYGRKLYNPRTGALIEMGKHKALQSVWVSLRISDNGTTLFTFYIRASDNGTT